MIHALVDPASQKLDRLGPQEISNMLWRPAAAVLEKASLFHDVAVAGIQKPLEGQSLASIFWCLGTTLCSGRLTVETTSATFVTSAHTCGPVETANIGWAVGTLRHFGFAVPEVLGNAAKQLSMHFAHQELASIARTLAVFDVSRKPPLTAPCNAGCEAVPRMDVRCLAGISWAFVVLVANGACIIRRICEHSGQLLECSPEQFSAQSLASMARFLSSFDVGQSPPMDQTVRLSCSVASSFRDTEAAMLSWSLCHSGRLELCWRLIDAYSASPNEGSEDRDRAALAVAAIGPLLATHGLEGDAEGFAKSLKALVSLGELPGLVDPSLKAAGMALAELGRADAAVESLQRRANREPDSLAKACGLYIESDANLMALHGSSTNHLCFGRR